MAYIELNNGLPGITGLLENRPDTGAPIRKLTRSCALFCLYNRYVDGLGTYHPEDPAYYQGLANRLVTIGYGRPKDGARKGEASFK